MIQVFKRKAIHGKCTAGVVTCLIGLMCLFSGNVWGQEIISHGKKEDKYYIIVKNSTKEYLIIFKNDIKEKKENIINGKNGVSATKSKRTNTTRYDATGYESINIIMGTKYEETAPFIFLLQDETQQISFKTSDGNIYFYKLNKGDVFSEAGSESLSKYLKEQESILPTNNNKNDNIPEPINSKDEENKARTNTEPQPVTPQPKMSIQNTEEVVNTIVEPSKPKDEPKPKADPQKNSKSIDYNQQITELEIQAKAFDYVLKLKDGELDSVKIDLLSKDSINVRVLLNETNKLRTSLNKETLKDKKSHADRLNNLNSQLRKIKDAIAYLLVDLDPKIKNELIDKFGKNFREITDSQFTLVRRYIDENRYKDNWYNWWGKWKYEKMLDNLEYNKDFYIQNSKNFIDSIGKIPEYGEKGRKLLINQQENIDSRFENINNSRQILKTDFAIPVAKLSIFGVLLIVIIVVMLILIRISLRNKKIKKDDIKRKREIEEKLGKITFREIDDTKNKNVAGNEDTSISSTERPKFKHILKKYEHGLDQVKSSVGKFYKEINMFDFVDNSSIHKVYISREFIKELYKFFNEFLKSDGKVPETGCYIIGRWDYSPNTDQQAYDISLEYIVKPGKDAKYSEYECDFGAEIGTSLIMENRKYSEQSNIEYVHTSWMHSHPGLRLFLSSQDLIVQSTLTNNSPYKRMLAIVIDTNTEDLEMAFFSPKPDQDKVMNNDADIKKILTLDELHDWAETEHIEPQKEQQPTVKFIGIPAKEYFAIPVKQRTENFNEIKLTRAVIVDMSTGNEGLLYGKSKDNQLLIDTFVEKSEDGQNEASGRIGIFKKVSSFDDNAEWEEHKKSLLEDKFWESNQIRAIYCQVDKILYLFTGKISSDTLETQNPTNIATVVSFQELKKWTREKRK